jgi:hypothetical protein
VAPAIPVAVPATASAPTASATVLPSTTAAASTPTLFGPVAAFAVDRTVPTGLKRYRGGLATTGTNYRGARAHTRASARAVTPAIVLRVRGSVATTTTAAALFRLAARLAAPGRGVAAFLEKLLFTSSEDKFLTAVATS